MKNIVLTITLRSDSEKESELMEHLNKFKSGKGFQERTFELRRLLIAGLTKGISTSNSTDVKNEQRTNVLFENAYPINKNLNSTTVLESAIEISANRSICQTESQQIVALVNPQRIAYTALSLIDENLPAGEAIEGEGILASFFMLQEAAKNPFE